MKNIILLLFMSVFVSCQSLEHTSENCSPIFVYTDETKKLIDADLSVCVCRKYKFSETYVGSLSGTSIRKPLNYCDKLLGFKDWAATTTFWEEARRSIQEDKSEKFNGFPEKEF